MPNHSQFVLTKDAVDRPRRSPAHRNLDAPKALTLGPRALHTVMVGMRAPCPWRCCYPVPHGDDHVLTPSLSFFMLSRRCCTPSPSTARPHPALALSSSLSCPYSSRHPLLTSNPFNHSARQLSGRRDHRTAALSPYESGVRPHQCRYGFFGSRDRARLLTVCCVC